MNLVRYSANITAGALKIGQSRVVAALLLEGAEPSDWLEEVRKNNVLQARSEATAVRLARLIRDRLMLFDRELWRLVRDGSRLVATHAMLSAAVKHSALLGDFLDLVVREQYRLFKPALSNALWEEYLVDCRGRDPAMPLWRDSTIARLRSTVFQTLAQAGYLESTRTLRLQPVTIEPELVHYLRDRDERYVLRCVEVSP